MTEGQKRRKRVMCPKYVPWLETHKGDILTHVCYDIENKIIKDCDYCKEDEQPK